MVVSSTAAINLDLAQPYTLQRQNLTQPFYLFLNIAILYALAHQVARLSPPDVARTVDRAVISAILFASGVAIWEMAHFYGGVPFADAFFHSNIGYARAHGQILAGEILRTSGPFSEPSALAYHFAGFLLFTWCRYVQRPSPTSMVIVLLCLAVMAASTSTSAFAVIGFFALVVLKDTLAAAVDMGKVRLSSNHLVTLVLLSLAALGVTAFVESHWRFVDEVLTQMVFEKSESGSFEQRTGVDLLAVEIVMQTLGIGVGLGSHKPNNLAMTLLSNTGIAGCLTFLAFLFDLIRPSAGTNALAILRPLRWLVIGLLVVHLIANPNLSSAMLWIGFALIIGARCHQQRPSDAGRFLVAGSRGREQAVFARVQRSHGL